MRSVNGSAIDFQFQWSRRCCSHRSLALSIRSLSFVYSKRFIFTNHCISMCLASRCSTMRSLLYVLLFNSECSNCLHNTFQFTIYVFSTGALSYLSAFCHKCRPDQLGLRQCSDAIRCREHRWTFDRNCSGCNCQLFDKVKLS